MTDDKRRERLRFRSWHRGTREIDLILGSFADRHLHTFTNDQVAQYEALLGEADPDLYGWITGMESPPPAHDNAVMRLLCEHRFADTKVN